jgi:hypothetical protein
MLRTQRNHPLLSHQGYYYRKDKKSSDNGWFFRCVKRHCPGRLHTNDEYRNPVARGQPHNHLPIPEETPVREALGQMKQRARTETTSIGQIYREESALIPQSSRHAMPTVHSIDSTLYRERASTLPPLPVTRAEIILPLQFTTTQAGDQFFQDSINNGDILIFATDSCLRALCEVDLVFVDGTFSTVPPQFGQLFSFHSLLGGKLLPRVYVLMSRRDRDSYILVIDWIRARCQQLNVLFAPANILSDFETSLIAAFRDSMPGTLHRGCYFHLAQALWRNVQTLGLRQLYLDNHAVRMTVRQLMGLGFLPLAIVRHNFHILRQTAHQALDPLFQYFERQWLQQTPLIMWNVYRCDIRTNNHLEGWHRRFNGIVGKYHANLWQFVKCLRDEQDATDLAEQQFAAGFQIARPTSRIYRDVQNRIERLTQRYTNGEANAVQFLEGVAHCIGTYL